jgi:hypothetical protein
MAVRPDNSFIADAGTNRVGDPMPVVSPVLCPTGRSLAHPCILNPEFKNL